MAPLHLAPSLERENIQACRNIQSKAWSTPARGRVSRRLGGQNCKYIRRPKLSSTELESGNLLGAFLQTPARVLAKISLGRAQFLAVPALDKIRSPIHVQVHAKGVMRQHVVDKGSYKVSFSGVSDGRRVLRRASQKGFSAEPSEEPSEQVLLRRGS